MHPHPGPQVWTWLRELDVVVRRVQWVAELNNQEHISVDLVVEYDGRRFIVEMKTSCEDSLVVLHRYAMKCAARFVHLEDKKATWKTGEDKGKLVYKGPLPHYSNVQNDIWGSEESLEMGVGVLAIRRYAKETVCRLYLREWFLPMALMNPPFPKIEPILDMSRSLQHVATDEEKVTIFSAVAILCSLLGQIWKFLLLPECSCVLCISSESNRPCHSVKAHVLPKNTASKSIAFIRLRSVPRRGHLVMCHRRTA